MATIKAVQREIGVWYKRTEPHYRTIDNLRKYLSDRGIVLPTTAVLEQLMATREPELPFNADTDENRKERYEVQLLVWLLGELKLDFVFTPRTIDSLLRPKSMHDFVVYSYEYFLEWCSEHPWLYEKIRKSAFSALRLQIVPVYPADGDFLAWIFDPWGERVYQFSNVRRTGLTNVVRKCGVVISSLGLHSNITLYKGADHPFKKIVKRIQSLKVQVAAHAVNAL